MTNGRSQAGHKGGTQTLKRHGQEHFKKIGALGGRARKKPRVSLSPERS